MWPRRMRAATAAMSLPCARRLSKPFMTSWKRPSPPTCRSAPWLMHMGLCSSKQKCLVSQDLIRRGPMLIVPSQASCRHEARYMSTFACNTVSALCCVPRSICPLLLSILLSFLLSILLTFLLLMRMQCLEARKLPLQCHHSCPALQK